MDDYFIIIPVLLLVYFSFIDINGHFSFTNYRQVFNEIFKNDVGFYFYATLITIITLIISYPQPILLDLQNSKIFGYLY